jgi:hypothetical protein
MMIIVLCATSSPKCLIICFSLVSIIEIFGSSCYIWQAGSSWCLSLRPGSQIGGYLLENGCIKSYAKGLTRSSSSSSSQYGSSETVMSFARKASRFNISSWQSEMKACSGSELVFHSCRTCYSRIASSFFFFSWLCSVCSVRCLGNY